MKRASLLLGLGFDAQDKHQRITRGKNFYIFGGSQKTHSLLQEGCVKFNEELKKRRKSLNNVSSKEFCDIAHKIGLTAVEPKSKGGAENA